MFSFAVELLSSILLTCSQDCAFEHASEAVAKDKHDLEKEHGDKVRQNLVLARDHVCKMF